MTHTVQTNSGQPVVYDTAEVDDLIADLGDGVTILDEDDMVTDSATAVPSQQSVKAYVDAEVAAAADGQGVPVGGTTGQVLAKASATDYDTEWVDESAGGGSGRTMVQVAPTSTAQTIVPATYDVYEFNLENCTADPAFTFGSWGSHSDVVLRFMQPTDATAVKTVDISALTARTGADALADELTVLPGGVTEVLVTRFATTDVSATLVGQVTPLIAGTTPAGPITFGNTSSGEAAAGSGAFTITTPTGVSTGDLLILAATIPVTNSASTSPPAGWTQLYANVPGGFKSFYIWVKEAGGSDSSQNYSITPGEYAPGKAWVCAAISGADTTSLALDHAGAYDAVNETLVEYPALTTSNNDLVLRISGHDGTTLTAGSGLTLEAQQFNDGVTDGVAICTDDDNSVGAATSSTAGLSFSWGVTVAIPSS
jgi:hypothetical protein